MKKVGFTLTEVLVSLFVIGIVAVLTIPNVTQNTTQKANTTSITSTIQTLNNSVNNMMVNEHTTNIEDTSLYNDINDFLNNYVATSKVCEEFTECFASSYKALSGDTVKMSDISSKCKNNSFSLSTGAVVCYIKDVTLFKLPQATNHTAFIIDINGTTKPNTVGRDLFTLGMSENGFVGVLDDYSRGNNDVKKLCTNGDYYGNPCVYLLQTNSWDMDY